MSKVSATTETVTPEMAESWLEKNKDNRPVRDFHVAKLAKDMKEGRWQINGEAIVFDSNGNLVDGQHRLWAGFNSQCCFQSIVVRGVAPEAFQTIDSGMKRSAADVLTKAGMQYGTLTAAALRLVHFYETGRRDHAVIARMSNAETLAVSRIYPRISQAVAMVGPSNALKKLFSLSALTATVYFTLEADADETASFLDALANGESLQRGHPYLTCRNSFIGRRSAGATILARVQFALLIKAWNAAQDGRDLSALKFVDGEDFPEFSHRVRGRKSKRAAA